MGTDERDSCLKYRKVEAEIRKLIDDAEDGARLPSERKLAELLGISFLTVRRGLQVLVEEGRIERRSGSGTFVAERVPASARKKKAAAPMKDSAVCLLVFRDSDAYAHRILHATDEAAQAQGINLRHAWITDLGEAALQRVTRMASEGVKALIFPWIPPAYTSGEGAVRLHWFIEQTQLPVTLAPLIPGLERYCFQTPAVYGADLVSSTETLCAYFSFLGHRHIALLGPDDTENLLFQKRIVGYSYFASKAGLDHLVAMVSDTDEEIMQIAQRWKKHQGDLAVICYDDVYAMRFMQVMHGMGLRAPVDFCIIGFNDTLESRATVPPLTTVMPNYADSANNLLRAAVAAATGDTFQSEETPCPLTFIVRESCGGREQVGRIMAEMGDKLNIICED